MAELLEEEGEEEALPSQAWVEGEVVVVAAW